MIMYVDEITQMNFEEMEEITFSGWSWQFNIFSYRIFIRPNWDAWWYMQMFWHHRCILRSNVWNMVWQSFHEYKRKGKVLLSYLLFNAHSFIVETYTWEWIPIYILFFQDVDVTCGWAPWVALCLPYNYTFRKIRSSALVFRSSNMLPLWQS